MTANLDKHLMSFMTITSLLLTINLSCDKPSAPAPLVHHNETDTTFEQSPPTSTDIKTKLSDYTYTLASYGYSFAAYVSTREGTLLKNSFGLAHIEQAVAWKNDTGFHIASLNKQMIAAGILKLEVENKLSTTDLITKHIPDVPEDKSMITIDHLLLHRAGLGYMADPFTPEESHEESRTRFINGILNKASEFPPGTQFSYSNEGYAMLAAIIEYASGKPIYEYYREHLWKPAGITNSGFVCETNRWKSAKLATGYNGGVIQSDARLLHRQPYSWITRVGIISTLEDMIRWELAHRENKVLPADATSKFFSPGKHGYGNGWWRGRSFGNKRVISHGGHIQPEGFNCFYIRIPEDQFAVIVLANEGGGSTAEHIATNLSKLALNIKIKQPKSGAVVAPEVLQHYVGHYDLVSQDAGQDSIEISMGSRGLSAKPSGQQAVNCFVDTDKKMLRKYSKCYVNTERFLQAMTRNQYEQIENLLTKQRTKEQWVQAIRHAWIELLNLFGPFNKFEVLHCVPMHGQQVRTYARVTFERGSPILAYDWRGSSFTGMTDHFGFYANKTERPVRPGRLSLCALSTDTFSTFDLFTGQSIGFRFELQDGKSVLHLTDIEGGSVIFEKRND